MNLFSIFTFFISKLPQVSDVQRETEGGFTKGKILIEGTGIYQGQQVLVYFQNEYLVAKMVASGCGEVTSSTGTTTDATAKVVTTEAPIGDRQSNKTTEAATTTTTTTTTTTINTNHSNNKSDILATSPDLITLIESETGEPIQSSNMKYGLRVSVLVLPAPSLIRSDTALPFTGPKAFGFNDLTYTPIGVGKEYKSIAK